LGVERLDERVVLSTFSVLNLADSGDGSLRAAITAANSSPGADVVSFAPGLRGTIGLTSGELAINENLWIDGPGAGRIAVSGNDTSRVFSIASGAAVTIDDLTVTRGHGLLRGGGIANSGNLTLTRAVVSDNEVVGLPGSTPAVDAFGGGIYSTGSLTVSHSRFVGNRSIGGDGNPGGPGSTGLGGAIMSAGVGGVLSTATISHCTFVDNEAQGGAIGAGAPFTRSGIGGAILTGDGSMTVSHSQFHGNRAIGGAGGGFPGAFGAGGAIANASLFGPGILTVSHCSLTGNEAVGGAAAPGASPQAGKGGAIANFVPAVAAPTASATLLVTHSTLLGNKAVGGSGTNGGAGQGGAISNENGGNLTVTSSLIALNRAIGGAADGGAAGNGLGGGIFNAPPGPHGAPTLTLDRSLVALNRAEGGAATGGGTAGQGIGGGVYIAAGSVASADLTAIVANDASTSDDDLFGLLL
jgi:hypothetical protein